MSFVIFYIIAVVSVFTAGFGAYFIGYKRGRDRGWLDRQDQLWKEEKARRDAAGRFRSTKLIIRQL